MQWAETMQGSKSVDKANSRNDSPLGTAVTEADNTIAKKAADPVPMRNRRAG